MAAVGGSIESIALDGREFAVAADADSNRKLGGFENDVQANGNGTARLVKTRVPPMLDGLTLSIDDARADHEYLQGLADRNDFFPIVITYASGQSYQGRGQITAEMQVGSQNTTAQVTIMGNGVFTRQ